MASRTAAPASCAWSRSTARRGSRPSGWPAPIRPGRRNTLQAVTEKAENWFVAFAGFRDQPAASEFVTSGASTLPRRQFVYAGRTGEPLQDHVATAIERDRKSTR